MKYLLLVALPLVALAAEPVTYSKQIAPILFAHCTACHRPGEAAPFALLSYDDARKHAGQIAEVTARRYMPPWLPEPGHGEFSGVRRLSAEQIALIGRWAKEGAVEGDPAQAPKPPHFVAGWELGEPDLVLHMRQPFKLSAQSSDVFRNFILPVELKDTEYIRAMELRPGNKKVVHHANLIVDYARRLRARDGEDGQPGFPGMEVETEAAADFTPESHFLFWKPGTQAQQSPDDMGWKLSPGSDLIVNLHLQPSGKTEVIDASVGLYFAKGSPKRFPMLLQLEHDGAIDIPPGAARFTVADHLKLPVAVDVLAVYPHAHYLGKEIEAWAELPGGERRRLLLIKDWDINWQATYAYATPVALPAGTTLAMRITYDNSAQNPRNPSHPPVHVTSGNRSVDEMGHVWFQVLPRAAQEGDPRLILQEALMRRRLEKYPSDFVAHFNLGAALQTQGKPEEALPILTEAVRIRPTSATAHNNLAISLVAVERFVDAIRELRQTLTLDPSYQSARFNLASILAGQGDNEGALRELRAYLQAVPDDAQAQEFTGRTLAAQGKFAESVPYFRRAAELQPGDAGFETNLGAALAQSGSLPEAVAAFERALKVDPSSQAARDNLARARASLAGRQ